MAILLRKKPNNQDRHNAQYGGKQNNKWNCGVSCKESSGSKSGFLVQKMSRINSKRISNKCSPFSKKFVYRKNPKLATGRKTSSFEDLHHSQFHELRLGEFSIRLYSNFIHKIGITLWVLRPLM